MNNCSTIHSTGSTNQIYQPGTEQFGCHFICVVVGAVVTAAAAVAVVVSLSPFIFLRPLNDLDVLNLSASFS